MARLIINSRFKPFTYDELIKPVAKATEAHQLLEEGLGEVQAKTNLLDHVIREEVDPELRAKYNTYQEQLNNASAALASQGLAGMSRSDLINLKNLYTKHIAPAEVAHANIINNIQKPQQQALMNDSSLIFDTTADSMSLQKMIENPYTTYNTISGNKLTAQAQNVFSNFAKAVRDNPQKWESILGGTYVEKIINKGFTISEIQKLTSNNYKVDLNSEEGALLDVVNKLYNSTGVATWNNPEAEYSVMDAINLGMWNALGSEHPERLQMGSLGQKNGNKEDKDDPTKIAAFKGKLDKWFYNDLDHDALQETYSDYLEELEAIKEGKRIPEYTSGAYAKQSPEREMYDKFIENTKKDNYDTEYVVDLRNILIDPNFVANTSLEELQDYMTTYLGYKKEDVSRYKVQLHSRSIGRPYYYDNSDPMRLKNDLIKRLKDLDDYDVIHAYNDIIYNKGKQAFLDYQANKYITDTIDSELRKHLEKDVLDKMESQDKLNYMHSIIDTDVNVERNMYKYNITESVVDNIIGSLKNKNPNTHLKKIEGIQNNKDGYIFGKDVSINMNYGEEGNSIYYDPQYHEFILSTKNGNYLLPSNAIGEQVVNYISKVEEDIEKCEEIKKQLDKKAQLSPLRGNDLITYNKVVDKLSDYYIDIQDIIVGLGDQITTTNIKATI